MGSRSSASAWQGAHRWLPGPGLSWFRFRRGLKVAGILRDQITSGKIEPRRPIPSIRTLCQTYGIARATAGKAIRLLADEGLIRRVPGKGWFVTPESERPA